MKILSFFLGVGSRLNLALPRKLMLQVVGIDVFAADTQNWTFWCHLVERSSEYNGFLLGTAAWCTFELNVLALLYFRNSPSWELCQCEGKRSSKTWVLTSEQTKSWIFWVHRCKPNLTVAQTVEAPNSTLIQLFSMKLCCPSWPKRCADYRCGMLHIC